MVDRPAHQHIPFDRSEFTERVRAFVRQEDLWATGQHLLVAVSGGPDSVALLDLLATVLASEQDLRVSVAHIDHGLRAEAGEDAAFVEALAAAYALPLTLQQVDVPARVAETGETVEEAARILRYAALDDIAHAVQADRIVTGHTADDQAETVLMRVLRGTGVTGLAGIPPRRGAIVRPLLPVWRREIETYVQARNLSFRIDATNLVPDFTRNRIRLELLPYLEREYAPRLRERLHHLAELARQDDRALEEMTDYWFTRTVERRPVGIALVPDPQLPQAINGRLWRRAIAEVTGSLENIAYEHIAAITQLPPGGEVHLPGVRVLHEAGRLVFLPTGEEMTPPAISQQPLPVPGQLCLPEAGCCLHLSKQTGRAPIASGNAAVMDATTICGPLVVRSWQPGDRYRPLGTQGSRKVQDIFVDAGVPRRLRAQVPVVLDDAGIVWLAGFRIADRVKITPATAESFCLHIEWELNPWTLQRSRHESEQS